MLRTDLNHPELPGFEPIIKQLWPLVFESGTQALQKAKLLGGSKDVTRAIDSGPAAFRRFIRGCHYGWDLAQGRLSKLVLAHRLKVIELRTALQTDITNRNVIEINRKKSLIVCLELRQIVLRRLADAILYHLIKMQNWILRRVSLEDRIREIDPTVLERTVRKATELNRAERLNFHLACDLTTAVHVGDLIKVNFASQAATWTLIELKEGKLNTLLNDIIEKSGGDLPEARAGEIRERFGPKAVSQARRMIRQRNRQRELMKLIETDEGIDIRNKMPIKLFETVGVDDYREILGDLSEKARSRGLAAHAVDNCLRLIAVREEEYKKLGRRGVAFLFYQFQFRTREYSSPSDQLLEAIYPFSDLALTNLLAMWPPPLYLWLPEKMVLDLLFGRISIFAQLDFSELFKLARTHGLEMRWVSASEMKNNQRLTSRIPGSPGANAIGVKLLADSSVKEHFILTGFISRMFLELMSPSQFLRLVRRDFEFTNPPVRGTPQEDKA